MSLRVHSLYSPCSLRFCVFTNRKTLTVPHTMRNTRCFCLRPVRLDACAMSLRVHSLYSPCSLHVCSRSGRLRRCHTRCVCTRSGGLLSYTHDSLMSSRVHSLYCTFCIFNPLPLLTTAPLVRVVTAKFTVKNALCTRRRLSHIRSIRQ